MRTRCWGFSASLQLVSPVEHPIMNSPAGIFTNSMPMAFFRAPACAAVWAFADPCARRQVTAMANVPTTTNLMSKSLRCVDVEHVSKPACLSTELSAGCGDVDRIRLVSGARLREFGQRHHNLSLWGKIGTVNFLKVGAVLIFGAAQVATGQSVTGTVRLPGGMPAAGVRVMTIVVPGPGRGGINQSSVLASLTQTDSAGFYRLDNIPPGRYYLAAGPVASPTLYPGTQLQDQARVITITRDSPSLSGIDFALTPTDANPRQSTNQGNANRCCYGVITTEDGSPLPTVSLKVVETGSKSSVAVYDGLFRLILLPGTTAQLAVEGLPPGYSLKSIVYGGKSVGPALLIDGRDPPSLLLTL